MKKFIKKMANILVNGADFKINHSLKIYNNRIYIDGNEVTPDSKNITISIEGDVKNLEIDSCGSLKINGNVDIINAASADIDVVGDVNSISTASGEVDVKGNVSGSVSATSGDIDVSGHIYGKTSTISGDIDCKCKH